MKMICLHYREYTVTPSDISQASSEGHYVDIAEGWRCIIFAYRTVESMFERILRMHNT